MNEIQLLYIDLFCGAGGTSSGVEFARYKNAKCAKVIACVNHDKNAILSHAANHPDVMHFTEDIRTLELSPLVDHLKKMKAKHPNARVALWQAWNVPISARPKVASRVMPTAGHWQSIYFDTLKRSILIIS